MIITLPNFLSALRVPLAFVFLSENPLLRMIAIFAAMISDVLDGYLARRNQQVSQFGAFLDPLTDKFFMIFVLTAFLLEHRLEAWQMATLLSRDGAVLLFGVYLGMTGGWSSYQLRSIWAGKVSTSLQFFTLIAILYGVTIPVYLYYSFIVLGILALAELCFPLLAYRRVK